MRYERTVFWFNLQALSASVDATHNMDTKAE
jgi:hypothetical protein